MNSSKMKLAHIKSKWIKAGAMVDAQGWRKFTYEQEVYYRPYLVGNGRLVQVKVWRSIYPSVCGYGMTFAEAYYNLVIIVQPHPLSKGQMRKLLKGTGQEHLYGGHYEKKI